MMSAARSIATVFDVVVPPIPLGSFQ